MTKKTGMSILWAAVGIGLLFLLTGCSTGQKEYAAQVSPEVDTVQAGTETVSAQDIRETAAGLPYTENEYTITIPGLTGTYRFVFVNDLHIIVQNDEIKDEKREDVKNRTALFTNDLGETSQQMWEKMAPMLDSLEADAILLGGDMVDFMSVANSDCLLEGLEQIETPVLYVRADHDYGTWNTTLTKEEVKELELKIDSDRDVFTMDFGEFLMVGLNNNTSQVTPEAAGELEEIFAQGKPIILVAHVPYASLLDEGLNEASKEAWGDRALIWGEDTSYQPDENTRRFMDLLYAPDSPVAAVLCGHLHFPYTSQITENTVQYVFDASYKGNYGIVTVSGQDSNMG